LYRQVENTKMSDVFTYDTRYSSTPYLSGRTYNCSGEGILDLIKNVDNPVGIEIGSDVGETASHLLKTRQDLFLYCIDPYVTYVDWNNNHLNDREDVLQKFLNIMKPYESRYKLLRMNSDDAVDQFIDGSVDFVFVDGLHEYDQTFKDCQNYWPKLKTGGLFSGHDYQTIPGVNKSVNEFAHSINKQVLTTTNDMWYYFKD
jgi:predicted O-methyltransferase YrrM